METPLNIKTRSDQKSWNLCQGEEVLETLHSDGTKWRHRIGNGPEVKITARHGMRIYQSWILRSRW